MDRCPFDLEREPNSLSLSRSVPPLRSVPRLRLINALTYNEPMPIGKMPKRGNAFRGALPMLILRVLQSGSLHGYALAQRIHVFSSEVLAVEEGLLYPTLRRTVWIRSA